MAGGRDTGGTGTVAETGTYQGGQGYGTGVGREDGAQAVADHATGRLYSQAGQAGGKSSDVAQLLKVSRRTLYRALQSME